MNSPAPLAVISGVAGMTGSEAARQLLARGWRVIGFDNFFASGPAQIAHLVGTAGFEFLELDLCRARDMETVARRIGDGEGAVAFLNCAAVVHTRHFYHPSATFETNVVGMKAFLELAVRLGAASFINCSTSEVYSLRSFAEGGVRESDPLLLAGVETSQRASYAVGKLLTEFFLAEAVAARRIRGCSIRFANVYSGDELLPEHIIPYAIESLRRGPEITLLENARNTSRTFLHNRDSAAAVVALLGAGAALDGSAYNVGTDVEIRIVDLVAQIGARLGVVPRITFTGVRTADPERRLLNTAKVRGRTGWAPAVGLEQGLQWCVEAARRRPPGEFA